MSETIVCFWNTMQCNREACPAYHDASLQCMWGMWLNAQLGVGKIDPLPREKTAEPSGLVVDAMKGQLDFSQIEWMIKGNKEARDTDPFAYAFAFKYQTEELQLEFLGK